MAWIELALAMALFLASHRIPAALGVKGRLLAALGPRGYGILFSVASVLLLWWLISAAGRAPFVPLWDQEPWHRWAAAPARRRWHGRRRRRGRHAIPENR